MKDGDDVFPLSMLGKNCIIPKEENIKTIIPIDYRPIIPIL